MNKSLSLTAIFLSLVALVSVMVNIRTPRSTNMAELPVETTDLQREVQDLQAKYSELDKSHQALLNQWANLRNATFSSLAGNDKQVENKLNNLEKKQSELEAFTRDIDKYGIIQSKEIELAKAYKTLLDESLPIWTRVKQVDELKRYGQFDEQAIATMKNAWNEAEDNKQRAGILHALDGHVDEDMRDQILLSLAEEFENGASSPKFRYVAIDALEPMRSHPEVSQWLDYIGQNDPEQKIAQHAINTLQPPTETPPQTSK
jgi:DNA repair exonuclease SbcCD ATPase subunit